MRYVFSILVFFCVVALESSQARETHIVAIDGSGDFLQIQDAIVAAAAGDLILVKPGTYDSILIDKPLTIVGSGEEETIVNYVNAKVFLSVPIGVFGQQEGVTVIANLGTSTNNSCLETAQSLGASLALWRLRLDNTLFQSGDTLVFARELGRAWFNNCTLPAQPDPYGSPSNRVPGLAVNGVDTFVSETSFRAWDITTDATTQEDGGTGILAANDCILYVAESDITGGRGGNGLEQNCVDFRTSGDGGDGIRMFEGCEAWVFSRSGHTIRGGDGGDAVGTSPPGYCGLPPGGNGGDAIHAIEDDSWINFSGMNLFGGDRGEGEPPGIRGRRRTGNTRELDVLMPTSTMEGSGQIGSQASFHFHADAGDKLLILYAMEPDVTQLPSTEGHPLLVSPTKGFGVIPGGVVSNSGKASLTLKIPQGANPGDGLFVQGAVLGNHPPYLTNMSMVIVTPDWQ